MNSYIICAPRLDDAYQRALSMAAELTGNPAKVFKHSHPDVMTIYKEKSELTVDQVRNVVSDAYVLPNESDYKVYIFYDGKDMNTSAQNAALKLLEEPPKGVVIILLSTSASTFLQTIRSRCAEIYINSETADEDVDSFACDFLKAYASGNPLSLYNFCESNNKMTISDCKVHMESIIKLIADMMCGRKDNFGMSPDKLLALESLIEKCIKYLNANVNVKQIFGMIEVSL